MLPNTNPCLYCGGVHTAICHRVKAVTYNGDGTIQRVELFAPNDYPPIEGLIYGPGNSPPLPDIKKIQATADKLLANEYTVGSEKKD